MTQSITFLNQIKSFFVPAASRMNVLTRKVISTQTAPQPIGPYNQAIVADRTVYVSGCLGASLETGKVIDGGAAAQAELALTHLKNILLSANSQLENVVKTTIYLQDLNDFQSVNETYKKVFTTNHPARTTIQIAKLPLNALVEIEAIALVGPVKNI